MKCVRNSYLRYVLYLQTFIRLCSSWGLLHWHYPDDTAAQILPALIHFQNSTHTYPRHREGPFVPRKRYLMCKITMIPGLGSSRAAKRHTPPTPQAQQGLYWIPWIRGGSSGSWLSAFSLCACPARAACGLMAEAETEAPNEGRIMRKGTGGRLRVEGNGVFVGVPIISQSDLTTSLPAPFKVFYCPTGTKNRKWNGNNWNTRHDATSGKLLTPWLEFPVPL